MSRLRFFSLLYIGLLLLVSCGKEEAAYPPVLTEFASLRTDAQGRGAWLLTDRGECYDVGNADQHTGLTPDSLYRIVALYELSASAASASVHLYDKAEAIAPLPTAHWEGEWKKDPVGVQSIWLSGDYLNMVLLVKAQDRPHTFFFVEQERGAAVRLGLYHDRGDDVEAYTQQAYLSVPLAGYRDEARQVDFSLATADGWVTYTFVWP